MSEIDCQNSRIHWLNAGHGPAIIYTPQSSALEELAGRGSLPLGIDENFNYRVTRQDLTPKQIIAIATDGIFEALNPAGEMFGRRRFYDIIRQNASKPAGRIIAAVLQAVKEFRNKLPAEDDLTLVVVKFAPNS